ncbi:hypothetical protein [Amycolatopsis sp. PS_44_ISF1]|uniref:hypothetical protein n=1 Tax=Amycolatopsis sp. PS_44_ISF1 TaxID=2974917 RepID=UPI0028DD68F3|nr:hypothetical protein [Amycolatopsis sp. PS_44_ISF1]MDT8912521.1 hypothetical protein [Amycolatopsis sp. PS_44_ISF1]
MWFALGTPVVLMIGALLMERVEHYAEVPARAKVLAPEPVPEYESRPPLAAMGTVALPG